MRALIVGCGNASRRDDGVGLYVIQALAARFGLSENADADSPRLEGDVPTPSGPARVEVRFEQQLDIVLAAELDTVDLLLVVDAHTGAYPEALRRVAVAPGYTSSMTSHHLTPETLVGLAHALHGRTPRTVLFSVRGHDFNFGTALTPETRAAADRGIEEIARLVEEASKC